MELKKIELLGKELESEMITGREPGVCFFRVTKPLEGEVLVPGKMVEVKINEKVTSIPVNTVEFDALRFSFVSVKKNSPENSEELRELELWIKRNSEYLELDHGKFKTFLFDASISLKGMEESIHKVFSLVQLLFIKHSEERFGLIKDLVNDKATT